MDEGQWQGNESTLADGDEMQHLLSVLDSFGQYRRAAHYNITHVRRQKFYSIPTEQWTFLSKPPVSFLDTLSRIDDAIDVNAELAEAILSTGAASTGVYAGHAENEKSKQGSELNSRPPWHDKAAQLDINKARSTLNQLFRDWSLEGTAERNASFLPIIEELTQNFRGMENSKIKILVPGAGLGRFVFELCRRGYSVEGNEISYHQLLTSSFILNNTQATNEWVLYPWLNSFSNVLSREDQFRKVHIPDVHPREVISEGNMTMTAGDFVSIYSTIEYRRTFDAVATLFFIDTAPNLMTYIETIRSCLKDNGLWINLGPLLWHFEGKKAEADNGGSKGPAAGYKERMIGDEGGYELSGDEVIALVASCGFTILKYETDVGDVGYVQNYKSMNKSVYRPILWAATKNAQ